MSRRVALIVAFVQLACILSGAKCDDVDCVDDYQVKHLTLSITYGPGFCSALSNDCRGPYQDFSIHGLWPYTIGVKDGKYCCSKEKNLLQSLQPLISKMKTNWRNLRGIDTWLWQHEWDKHGKCAQKVPEINTPLLYFQFALNRFKNLNIMNNLKRAGLNPSNKKTYRGDDIADILRRAYGYRPEIGCKPALGSPNKMVLTEIRLCYTTDLKLKDCSYTNLRCREELYLLAEILKF